MARISVDDQVSELSAQSEKKLGDLLSHLVSALPPNKIVREILLNGDTLRRDQQASALEYPMDDVQDIQIRTVDKEIWAATGLDIALSCVERLQRSLIRAAELFRDEDKAEANHFFVHCIDGLERFIETIMITRCARQLDFSRIMTHGQPLSQVEREFAVILKTILECQEKGDFIGVADKVEYELLTNLSSWSSALRQLRLSAMSNA